MYIYLMMAVIIMAGWDPRFKLFTALYVDI